MNPTLAHHLSIVRFHRYKDRLRAMRPPTVESGQTRETLVGLLQQAVTQNENQMNLHRENADRFARHQVQTSGELLRVLRRQVEASETLAQVMTDIRSVVPGLSDLSDDPAGALDDRDYPPITPS